MRRVHHPLHVEHWHDRPFLARASPTAVCLAGEARVIHMAKVRRLIDLHLRRPLNGDMFLVLSPKWSNREQVQLEEAGLPDSQKKWTLTGATMQAIARELNPVTMAVAHDESMLKLLSQLELNHSETHAVHHCAMLQPLPARIEADSRETGGDGAAWHRSNFQTGACSPQLSLALRFRACLGAIELAERRRAGLQYTWVVRSRPDVKIPCALPFAALTYTSARGAVAFADDYLAIMPRAAAEVSLRQVPLARELNASACFFDIMHALPERVARDEDDFVYWHTMERCNPCIAELAGWAYAAATNMIWSESLREYDNAPTAIPWREEEDGHAFNCSLKTTSHRPDDRASSPPGMQPGSRLPWLSLEIREPEPERCYGKRREKL